MTTPHILIPVKSLADGKSRLAAVLGCSERRALNRELVSRTLATAARFAGAARCTVISGCSETLAFAHACGVQGLPQRDAEGLNAAVEAGVDRLRYEGAQDILVTACDLPLLQVHDLREMTRLSAAKGAVVIAADRHGQGTNLLFIPPRVQLRFSYGAGSLGRHFLEGVRAGRDCVVYRSDTAGFDIDTAPDLEQWRALARETLS